MRVLASGPEFDPDHTGNQGYLDNYKCPVISQVVGLVQQLNQPEIPASRSLEW